MSQLLTSTSLRQKHGGTHAKCPTNCSGLYLHLFGGCTVSTLSASDSSLNVPCARRQVPMRSEEEVGRVRTSPTDLDLFNSNPLRPVRERRNAKWPRP